MTDIGSLRTGPDDQPFLGLVHTRRVGTARGIRMRTQWLNAEHLVSNAVKSHRNTSAQKGLRLSLTASSLPASLHFPELSSWLLSRISVGQQNEASFKNLASL